MNKSVMKCCICNNENIEQFITINNKKYHLCCIEQLQQENKQQENAELKKQVEVGEEQYNNLVQEKEELQEQLAIKTLELENRKTGYIRSLNNQLLEDIEPDPEDFYLAEIEVKANDYDKLLIKQKEFIKYLEDEIKELQKIKETELDYDILKDVIPQLLACKEILQKYKSVIGVSDEKEN